MSLTAALRIGLISDTHGLLRPQAIEALRGSDHIVHAGDIGDPAILHTLAEIAPVTAVRGNNDRGEWADALHQIEHLTFGETRLYVIHDPAEMDIDPEAEGFQAVICGHSHRPKSEFVNGVLLVNPGSAGPRRFSLPVCVASLVICGTSVTFELRELDIELAGIKAAARTRPQTRGNR